MQRVLLLGTGRQGRVALVDLAADPRVGEVVAADGEIGALEAFVREHRLAGKLRCRRLDASDRAALRTLFAEGFDAVLSLLPVTLHDAVAEAAVAHGTHLVTSSYPSSSFRELDQVAAAKGVALLPEMGLDPGLDLILMAEAVRRLDRVDLLHSYAAGFPEARAATTPIRYKTTWTLEGVLRSYRRAGRVVREGRIVPVAADAMFAATNIHLLDIDGVGRLEAFPNGDTVHYLELLGIDPVTMHSAGRFVLRWPGHAAFWRTVVDLGLLDEEPVQVDGQRVDRRRFLAAVLEPRLRYAESERDVAVVRVVAEGERDGRNARVILELVDRRDLATGFFAMNRTVGFTAAIGVSLLLSGAITARGLLSPALHVPYRRVVEELCRRGIHVHEHSS